MQKCQNVLHLSIDVYELEFRSLINIDNVWLQDCADA